MVLLVLHRVRPPDRCPRSVSSVVGTGGGGGGVVIASARKTTLGKFPPIKATNGLTLERLAWTLLVPGSLPRVSVLSARPFESVITASVLSDPPPVRT